LRIVLPAMWPYELLAVLNDMLLAVMLDAHFRSS
jgi:hypothetical protein